MSVTIGALLFLSAFFVIGKILAGAFTHLRAAFGIAGTPAAKIQSFHKALLRQIEDAKRRGVVLGALVITGGVGSLLMLHSGGRSEAGPVAPVEVTAPPQLTGLILARMYYKDSLQREAVRYKASDIQYSLEGLDSTELTTTFLGPANDLVHKGYLDGASRRGYPLDDELMRALGFTATRAVDASGTVWERRNGVVKRLAQRRAAAVTPVSNAESEPSTTTSVTYFTSNTPVFASRESMKVAGRIIAQGVYDPAILGQHVACIAQDGDRFILLDASWVSKKIMIVDGSNAGCQGWVSIEVGVR